MRLPVPTSRRPFVILSITVILCSKPANAAELRPETLAAWQEYVKLTEARIQSELDAEPFLALDSLSPSDAAAARERLRSGRVYVQKIKTLNEEGKTLDIPKGMAHHWLGAILIKGVTVEDVLVWVQDCTNFERTIKQVTESRQLSQDGEVYRIFMKLKGGRFRTAHYNTEHVVEYERYGSDKASSKTEATRIAQLENAGTPNEREKPVGRDSGYMWRWNSYWRYMKTEEGVIVECESISLSRGVPVVFAWFIKPFIISVPKETLDSTLQSIRDALIDA